MFLSLKVIAVVFTVFLLGACGQKGPLTLPQPEKQQPLQVFAEPAEAQSPDLSKK